MVHEAASVDTGLECGSGFCAPNAEPFLSLGHGGGCVAISGTRRDTGASPSVPSENSPTLGTCLRDPDHATISCSLFPKMGILSWPGWALSGGSAGFFCGRSGCEPLRIVAVRARSKGVGASGFPQSAAHGTPPRPVCVTWDLRVWFVFLKGCENKNKRGKEAYARRPYMVHGVKSVYDLALQPAVC